jgi:hypothetical protein
LDGNEIRRGLPARRHAVDSAREVEVAAFLLWNVQNGNRDLLVQSIVREHKIDIVLLVEYSPTKTGSDLSNLLRLDGLVKRSTSERFGVFGRLNDGMILSPVTIGTRLELWDWTPDSGVGGRFALVHGLDRMNNDDGTRRVFFRRVADSVKAAEAGSHRRSIVVGDFNAQPFESAIVSSDGLHAIGIRQESNQTSRAIRLTDEREEFFYNPMWRLYGHVPSEEAGMATHYWQNRLAGELFWHMLDQVVLRPEECTSFPEDRIKILTKVGAIHLLAPDGIPDKTVGSDHLPLVFHWNL